MNAKASTPIILSVTLAVLLWGYALPVHAQIKIFNGKSGAVSVIGGDQVPPPKPPPQQQRQKAPQRTVVRDGPVTIVTVPAPIAPSSIKEGPSSGDTGPSTAVCRQPQATVQVVYNTDQVVYDLSGDEAFEKQLKIASDFSHGREMNIQESASGECLDSVDVTINVMPTIHLPSQLAVDTTGCKRYFQVSREQSFSQLTAAAYRVLGSDMEDAARQALAGKARARADAVNAIKKEFVGLFADFDAAQVERRKRFKAAQNPVATFDDCGQVGAKTGPVETGP